MKVLLLWAWMVRKFIRLDNDDRQHTTQSPRTTMNNTTMSVIALCSHHKNIVIQTLQLFYVRVVRATWFYGMWIVDHHCRFSLSLFVVAFRFLETPCLLFVDGRRRPQKVGRKISVAFYTPCCTKEFLGYYPST